VSINPPPPQYKGADLDPARGPGLGCFWLQVAILAVFVVLTPIGVLNGWPPAVSTVMLAVVLVLLFFVGQTSIFLLRLVAADRRGRRRPLASRTPTVGELESAEPPESDEGGGGRNPRAREDGGRQQGPAAASEPGDRPTSGDGPSSNESGDVGVRE
jgi:hypothetical protein